MAIVVISASSLSGMSRSGDFIPPRFLRAIVGLLIVSACLATAQDTVIVNEGFRQTNGFDSRKVAATTLFGGILAGSLVSSYFDWWKGASSPFHFVSEGVWSDYSAGIDKVGHFYTSYFYFRTFRNILLWGGYDRSSALWWSAGTAAFFALSIEIGDGVSPYGFSFEDLGFNLAGLGYAMLQTEVPLLRNVNFKWSYVPRGGLQFPPHFTDHYDWHTYWLTFNIHGLLPLTARDYWPEFLQLAVGYSIDGFAIGQQMRVRRELIIGLDFNLEAFKTRSEEVMMLQRTINMFHLPAPGVKFTEGADPRYYLFHLD